MLMQSKFAKLREKFDALLLREIAVFGGIPVHKGRLGQETEELRTAIAELLEVETAASTQPTILRFVADPWATGKFELIDLGVPPPLLSELMRVAAHNGISLYYLAAIYKEGRADATKQIIVRERQCAREGCNLIESEHGLNVSHVFERGGPPEPPPNKLVGR